MWLARGLTGCRAKWGVVCGYSWTQHRGIHGTSVARSLGTQVEVLVRD